uniref:Uncharacterized protein n=2 Tax=Dunaliella tertiolecta TaxID=3047 RepID=A0A6S8PN07_DUNTE|mmetsp:Transcript_16976/g.46958  ORF Transcript_16976/g.46958 Transcript_16976/m.46958 type:complete len:190 (-) Transcript_16976:977-1546(-)
MFGGGNKGWQTLCLHGPGGGCDCLLQTKRPKVEESLDELSFQRSACSAAQQGNVAKLQKILNKNPEAVHSDGAQDTTGYSPLHYAARAGHLEAVRILIASGANVNAATRAGRATPLMRAAHMGHSDVVRELISAGADGMLQDADHECAFHKAAAQGHTEVCNILAGSFPGCLDLRDKHGRKANEKGTRA